MRWFSKILKSKNSLKVFERTQNILQLLKKELKGLDWVKYKYNLDVLEKICNLVESEFNSKKKAEEKINKKEKVLEIIAHFISLNDEDKRIIAENIEHLHNTGRIRLVSNKRILIEVVKSFLGNSKEEE